MNSELIMQALEVMWKGMLSIFTVIIILTILVYLINKLAVSDPFRSGNGCFVVMLLSCPADRR